MLYRTMPGSGDELSILGFGAMRLPLKKNGAIDAPRAIRQLRTAVDRGVNYIDTAWPYHAGLSEPLVGLALANDYREKVKLATKLPSWLVAQQEDMDRYLHRQLERLGTDRIDYYLVHALSGPQWNRMAGLGVADFLDRAIGEGRIGSAGFSFHGAPEDFAPIVDAFPWTFCQIQYNYLDEEMQAGTAGLEYASARGLGVIVMEPLRGGNLARPAPPPAVQSIWAESETRRSPAEWALRWVWDRPEVTLLLSGMNDERHIEENITIAGDAHPGSLGRAERELVHRAAEAYRKLMAVGCTGCGYCLPCPEGVMIPECLDVFNTLSMYGDEQGAGFSYAVRMCGDLSGNPPGWASRCVACGECLKKCPQQIEIPEMMAEVAEALEGPDLEQRVALIRSMLSGETPKN